MPRRNLTELAGTAACAAMLVACTASLGDGARDTFTRITKCASGPVSAVPRPDSSPPTSGRRPPDDSADPGKLAYWQQRRAEPSRPAAPEADCQVFEVTGCGQKLLLCCRHPWTRDSTGVLAMRSEAVECASR